MKKYEYIKRLEKELQNTYSGQSIERCTKYARRLLDNNLPVIFDSNHIKQILKLDKMALNCYHEFEVIGKHKIRKITSPSKRIKLRQQWILKEILEKNSISSCCHGFVKGRSILTNAQMHIGKKNILNLDIKDFFPSISEVMVEQQFKYMGYNEEVSKTLTNLCCYKGKLPQGAPSSPYLSNLVLYNMDKELYNFTNKLGVTYTRYADDMTFSCNTNIEKYRDNIEIIIEKHGFSINDKKTKYFDEKQRKIVTGLIVKDDKVCVPKRFKRKFKQEIYYCKRLGVNRHLYNTGNMEKVGFKEYMYGKAYYIAMVEPEKGKYFLKELDSIHWEY